MTTWGAWVYQSGNTSNNGARIGYDFAFKQENLLHLTISVQTKYAFTNDTWSLDWSGFYGGNRTGALYSSANQIQHLMVDVPVVWHPFNSTQSATFTLSGLYIGVNPTVTVTTSLGSRPPFAPSNVVATLQPNGTSAVLTWQNNVNSERPTDFNNIYRYDRVTGALEMPASLFATNTYTDNGLELNRSYHWFVYAINGGGNTQSANSNTLNTTPAAPTFISAAREPGSLNFARLTYHNNAPVSIDVRVMRALNGGSWVDIGGVPPYGGSILSSLPLGSTAQYKLITYTDEPRMYSAETPVLSVGPGYTAPNEPTSVTSVISGSNLVISVTGGQSDSSQDKFWESIDYFLDTNGTVSLIGSSTGGVSSWTANGVISGATDQEYRVGVVVNNSGGSSPIKWGSFFYSTPSTPAGVVAIRQAESEMVDITFELPGPFDGSSTVFRSLNGGQYVSVGTVAAGTYSFTDQLPLTSTAHYKVSTKSKDGVFISSLSDASNMVESIAYDKDKIVGIDKIYAGTTKVYKVMSKNKQMWLG